MSTGGAHVRVPRSVPSPNMGEKAWLNNRLNRSWVATKSWNGSQRTIGITFTSLRSLKSKLENRVSRKCALETPERAPTTANLVLGGFDFDRLRLGFFLLRQRQD